MIKGLLITLAAVAAAVAIGWLVFRISEDILDAIDLGTFD